MDCEVSWSCVQYTLLMMPKFYLWPRLLPWAPDSWLITYQPLHLNVYSRHLTLNMVKTKLLVFSNLFLLQVSVSHLMVTPSFQVLRPKPWAQFWLSLLLKSHSLSSIKDPQLHLQISFSLNPTTYYWHSYHPGLSFLAWIAVTSASLPVSMTFFSLFTIQ